MVRRDKFNEVCLSRTPMAKYSPLNHVFHGQVDADQLVVSLSSELAKIREPSPHSGLDFQIKSVQTFKLFQQLF